MSSLDYNLHSLKADVLQYKPAVYSKHTKDKYVYFYVLDPQSVLDGAPKLKRIRTKFNDYKSARERDAAALRFRDEVNRKLATGWNPLVDSTSKRSWSASEDALDSYERYLKKLHKDGSIKYRTYEDYCSRLRRLVEYMQMNHIAYIHMFNRQYVEGYLEYLYVERGCLPRSRNNYLTWLNLFCNYLVGSGYLSVNPCSGIKNLKEGEKKRKAMTEEDRLRLFDWLYRTDRPYLLACQFMYYTLIRPIELSQLKVGDINFEHHTVFVSATISKNRHDGVVTIPDALMKSIDELRIADYPTDFYLFGDNFLPSPRAIRKPILFAKRWIIVRKELGFPDYYQFYSLKDTGITDMINKVGLNVAKDQARHSSVAITNYYAAKNQMSAHPELKDFE